MKTTNNLAQKDCHDTWATGKYYTKRCKVSAGNFKDMAPSSLIGAYVDHGNPASFAEHG